MPEGEQNASEQLKEIGFTERANGDMVASVHADAVKIGQLLLTSCHDQPDLVWVVVPVNGKMKLIGTFIDEIDDIPQAIRDAMRGINPVS